MRSSVRPRSLVSSSTGVSTTKMPASFEASPMAATMCLRGFTMLWVTVTIPKDSPYIEVGWQPAAPGA